MNTGVYQIRNLVNGKRYIGSSIDIRDRWLNHLNLLSRKKHHSIKLQRAWSKNGADAFVFEILNKECSVEQCIKREQYYLDSILFAHADDSRFDKLGYNICRIADSPMKGRRHTDQTKELIRLANSGIGGFWYGKKLSTDTKIKISKSKLGKKMSSGFCAKRSTLMSGESNTNSKLTIEDVIQIRSLLLNGVRRNDLAELYHVTKTAIDKIATRRTWRNV